MELGILHMEILTKETKITILQIGNTTKENFIMNPVGIPDYPILLEGHIFIMVLGILHMVIPIMVPMALSHLDGNGIKKSIIIKEDGTRDYQVIIVDLTFAMDLGIRLITTPITATDILRDGNLIKVNIIIN